LRAVEAGHKVFIVRSGKGDIRKGSAQERGQGLVEFALVAPVLLILVLGIVDFGWALRSWMTVTNSAREGARLGAVGATCDDIRQRAVDTSGGLLTLADVSAENCQGQRGTSVAVMVRHDYSFVTPLGGLLTTLSGGVLPSTITLTSRSGTRIE
jgi:Flp pilus assembly protein TadG